MIASNATLISIAAPGPTQDNGDAGTPEQVWAGKARGYLKRTRRQTISGGVNVPVRTDIFTLLRTAGAPVLEEAGADWEAYTVVIIDERVPRQKQQRRFTVRGMENRAGGTPTDSIRLELDNEGAV